MTRIKIYPDTPRHRYECFECGRSYETRQRLRACPYCENETKFHVMD